MRMRSLQMPSPFMTGLVAGSMCMMGFSTGSIFSAEYSSTLSGTVILFRHRS